MQSKQQMVQDGRVAEKALGRVNYELTEKEKGSVCFRRSLFVVADEGRRSLYQ